MEMTTDSTKREIRWVQAQRLQFIDFRLYWEGRINRGDLIDFYGISPQQASADLQEYLQMAGDSVYYDKSAKSYRSAEEFRPKFVPDQPYDYLYRLLSADLEPNGKSDSFIGTVPSSATLPNIQRHIDTQIFKAIIEGIREKLAIEIQYQSMTSPDAQWRWISPHALGFDGLRWHVRAYCHRHEEFRDFVFARMLNMRNKQSSDVDRLEDLDWTRYIQVRIGPHPELSEAQKKVIELDYGMENSESVFEVRAALVFYFLQRFSLDKESKKKSPRARQIVLLNSDELERYL